MDLLDERRPQEPRLRWWQVLVALLFAMSSGVLAMWFLAVPGPW